jgi:hypothetical protein
MKLILLVLMLVAWLIQADRVEAQWSECDDSFATEIDGNSLIIHHDGALYNCCPDPFNYTVDQDDSLILVTETEVLSNPCFCICCFDLSVTIEDLAPGVYDLIFTWFDYEADQWQEVVLDVVIPNVGQAPLPAVVDTYLSDCYQDPTAVPDDRDPGNRPPPEQYTWGLIKTLYR